MAKNRHLQAIEDMIAEKKREMETLQHAIDALQTALRRAEGQDEPKRKPRNSNVKAIVFELLEEAGSDGINGKIAVQMAAAKGVELDRGSVSSFLSRLKRDEVVHHDGAVYRLTKFKPDLEDQSINAAVVHHLPSRAMS